MEKIKELSDIALSIPSHLFMWIGFLSTYIYKKQK